MINDIIGYFQKNGSDYLALLWGHISISLISLLIAMAIAIPLGIMVYRSKIASVIAERGFGLLRIVPSLALLIILIPIMGTGVLPSVTALTILAIPPILINTIQAFRNLPPALLEAADGMGMSKTQSFFRVKLPLAFPLMFAGIRTAAIEIIASATLASYIGAGGLGDLIFTGLSLMRTSLLIIGGGSVAILSLLTGLILDLIYKRITRYQRA
ncbi:ABC transporter permease [Ruminococcus sp.]|uniref:ABC transporter permease n=1 Tax=Ruminococcus sp. TaxID=41978 RepID=UPI00388DC6B2